MHTWKCRFTDLFCGEKYERKPSPDVGASSNSASDRKFLCSSAHQTKALLKMRQN